MHEEMEKCLDRIEVLLDESEKASIVLNRCQICMNQLNREIVRIVSTLHSVFVPRTLITSTDFADHFESAPDRLRRSSSFP